MAQAMDSADTAQRNAHAVVAVLVVGALAVGIWLVPTAEQLGSHLHSDNQPAEAQGYLEHALRLRGPRPEIAIPLAQTYGQQGEPRAGLQLIRQLDAQREGAVTAGLRRRLLEAAGQPQALAAALEAARGADRDNDAIDALARVYGQAQLLELQAEVLRQAALAHPDQPARVVAAAHRLASVGQQDRALQLLQRLWTQRPDAFRAADFALLLQLQIALDPTDAALQLWRDHRAPWQLGLDTVQVASQFVAADRLTEAQSLLQPLVARAVPDADAVRLWARTMLAQGRAREAADVLQTLPTIAGLADLQTTLVEVALDDGDWPTALQIADHAGLDAIAGRALLCLASAVAAGKDRAALQRILAVTPKDAFAADPVTAVSLFLAAKDQATAQAWAKVARNAEPLPADKQLWLAELTLQMGRNGDAAAALGKYCAATALTPATSLRVAMLWWQANAPGQGLAAFDAQSGAHSAGQLAGRALLLAATGRGAEALQRIGAPQFVAILLREQADHVVDEQRRGVGRHNVLAWLSALAQIAAAQKVAPLAVFSVQQQLALQPNLRPLQWALVQAELDAAQPLAAVDALHALKLPLQAHEAASYRQALVAAYRAKAPVQNELVQVTLAYLAGADLRQSEPESWVHLLLELGANRQALPFVAQLAGLRKGAWAVRQVALLQAMGDTQAVQQLWRATAADATAPRQVRMDAAASLLAVGDRASALQAWQELAAEDPPDSAVVRQLVSLWGPRPGMAAVQWLVGRAKTAAGEAQLGWLRHAQWVGAHADVVAIVGPDPADGARMQVVVQSLMAQRQFKALAELTLRRAATLTDLALLQQLAELAAAHSEKPAAELAYLRLVELDAQHALALRYLAQTTTGARAEEYWRRYFALPPGRLKQTTWRDRAAFGHLLAANGKRADGRQQFAIALQLLRLEPIGDLDRALETGRLLAAMGDDTAALAELEKALAGRPCDTGLRADVVALLLGAKQYDRAKALVDVPDLCARKPR